jgi:hypothetical protein
MLLKDMLHIINFLKASRQSSVRRYCTPELSVHRGICALRRRLTTKCAAWKRVVGMGLF